MSILGSQNLPIFAFTEADASRITSAVRGNTDFLSSGTSATNTADLEKLYKKRIALDLHCTTLNHYYKLHRIPRGLRCNLQPTLFCEDSNFCDRFELILNKASFDILLLTIERLQTELVKLESDIKNLETTIFSNTSSDTSISIQQDLRSKLEPFKGKLEERKKRKFDRDSTDYLSGFVYRWRQPKSTPSRDQRGTRQFSDTSDSDTGSASFLGHQRPPNRQGGGAAATRDFQQTPSHRQFHYQTRSRNQPQSQRRRRNP